jgi:hypothetical protein
MTLARNYRLVATNYIMIICETIDYNRISAYARYKKEEVARGSVVR